MPELPEVETTLQGIKPYVENHTIRECRVLNPSLRWPVPLDLPKRLQGQGVQGVERRGKYIVMAVGQGWVLWHLGMSGSLRVVPAAAPLAKHDHVELIMASGQAIRLNDPRRFGCVLWHEGDLNQHTLLKHLGPEPLSLAFSLEYFQANAKRHGQACKLWIMNAKVVVGVGNIYANEALFAARIHPLKPAKALTKPQLSRLHAAIVQVLTRAIVQGGTTLRDFVNPEGKPGYFAQQLSVYGRAGLPCVVCAKPLTESRLGNRSTVYCTHCQK